MSTQPDQGVQEWFDASHAPLVSAKGWKSANDALASYAQLESHVGAPADRLIKLPAPDKIDDAVRSDVFKRIGYTPPSAPASVEEYGITVPEGVDPKYMQGVAAEALKLGITKEQLQGLAAFNAKFGESIAAEQAAAEEKTRSERRAAMESDLQKRFGDKYKDASEQMTRELLRLGYTAEEIEALESDLALRGEKDLIRFRSLVADIAELRRESPLHKGPGNIALSPEAAGQQLDAKMKDAGWRAKALERGTPEAEERLRLIRIKNGQTVDEAQIKREASGQLSDMDVS